jgi:hypothetical protein
VPDTFLPESSIELPKALAVKVSAPRFSESAEVFHLAGSAAGGRSSPGGVGAPPSGAGGGGGSDDGKLRSKIRNALESLIAEDDFFEGMHGDELSEKVEELVGVALRKYEMITMRGHRTTPEYAANAAIATMKSEARDADYRRYCREVEEGRINGSSIPPSTQSGPVPRFRFSSRLTPQTAGIHRKFRRIRRLGMWPGARVAFIDGSSDGVYRVRSISAECCVSVKGEGRSKGGLSPFRLAPVE